MRQNQPNIANGRAAEMQLLRSAEAAALLEVEQNTLKKFVHQRRIPVVRISRRCLRFRLRDLEAFIEKYTVPSLV